MDGIDNHIKDCIKHVWDTSSLIEIRTCKQTTHILIHNKPQILDSIIGRFSTIQHASDNRIVDSLRTYFSKQRT